MFRNKYNLCGFCILSALTIAQCRKYDIEQESRNLYGESLRSVVDRFRRTPEYLAILNDEVKELHKKLDAVGDRTAYVFSLKLYDRVVHEMGGNHTHVRTRPEELFPRMGKLARNPRISRQGQKNSPVNLLDGYNQLKHPLTLAEKNQMKELGFEYAAMAIHAMLDNMSPDDMPPMSTQLPYGGYPMNKTTTLHHHHQFTQPSTEHETHETRALHHATNIGRTGPEPEPTTSETVQ